MAASLREQLRRARKRYIRKPTNTYLRWYLNARGRLGLWDHRMHAYYGVPTDVTDDVKRFIARAYAAGLVPTATTNGSHAPGSYHYQRIGGKGRAADVGVRRELIGTAKATRLLSRFQRREYARHDDKAELIGPTNNLIILRGARTSLVEGSPLENQHDNHVHGAY